MTKKANEFLPDGYKYTSSTGSEFLKLESGDNKIRILSKPLIGRLWWMSPEGTIRDKGTIQKGDKPVRIEYTDELPEDIIDLQTKEFWMMEVWDYKDSLVKIFEVTQQTILKPLAEFIASEDWGDPREYDVNFKKEGSGKDTKYFVMPSPQKALAVEIAEELKEGTNTDLKSFLTENKQDPFEGMEDVEDPKESKKKGAKTDKLTDEDGEDLPF